MSAGKEISYITFFSIFLSDRSISASTIHITHYEVEDHVLQFDLPSFSSMDIYRSKDKNHLSTVYQRIKPESIQNRPLTTKKEVIDFANSYIHYLENEAKTYVDEFRYLPNILDAMDEDWKKGRHWSKVLGGFGPYHLFDGLIISKLCYDSDFQSKFNIINEHFMTRIDEEWKLVWLEFVPILESIQPKYEKN